MSKYGSSYQSSGSGTWSGSNNAPSYPGDSGGNTITYSSPTISSDSGKYGISGNVSVSTENGSNGLPSGVSGGSVGFTIHF